MDVSCNCRRAPPAKWPRGCASTTVPEALAPAGMATLPATSTGLARVAEKLWPGWLILEPTAWPRRTVSCAPAGTVMGSVLVAGGVVLDELSAAVLPESVEPLAPVGLLLQPTARSK